jgi:predicted nucleotidyltransferase
MQVSSGCALRTIGYLPAMTSTEVIEQIGVLLGKAAPPNSRVVLFGSHARGTANADSDYDVLVIEPTVDSPIQESVRLRDKLDELEVPIDVIVVDEAKAERRAAMKGTMIERALREGRLLAQT